MKSNYVVQQTPAFRLLSEGQLEELHFATLEVLRRTGVDVLGEEERQLLAEAGAKVDGLRVRIPPHLVDWAVRAAPSRVVLCDRAGTPAMYLEKGKGYYGTGSDTHNIIDPYTAERRDTVKADIANVATLCDNLSNIDFVMCMGIAHDVSDQISDLHHFEAMVHNTTKPIIFTAWTPENLKDIVAMAEIVAGGPDELSLRPFIALYAEPISPLRLPEESTKKLTFMAERGLPVIWTPGQTGGATSPVTIAGALVQGNAEALAGVVLAQLTQEGAPIVYGQSRLHLDMATALCSYGAPEFMLGVAGSHELARYYDLPVWSYGACSDSKSFDQQAAYVGAIWTFLSALSGGNLMHDVGYLEAGLTTSLEFIVGADELIGMVKRLMGGIRMDDTTIALDVIDEVGPGGEFLSHVHTYEHFKEDWVPSLFDRGDYESWIGNGSKTFGDRANERVRRILESHVADPLPDDVSKQLVVIIEEAASCLDS